MAKFSLIAAGSFNAKLDEAVKHAAKSVDLYQRLAVSAIVLSITDRNADPASRLVAAMHSGFRKDAMVAYLEAYGNLAWSKNDKKMMFYDAEAKGTLPAESKDADVLYAIAWESMKKAPNPKSMYDAVNEVDNFIQRMQKLAAAEKVVHPELIKVLALAKAKWTRENADKLIAEDSAES